MKNHYIRTAIAIDILTLLIFISGLGFYTYIAADKEADRCLTNAESIVVENKPGSYEDKTEEDLINDAQNNFWKQHFSMKEADSGFYGCLLKEGKPLSDSFLPESLENNPHAISDSDDEAKVIFDSIVGEPVTTQDAHHFSERIWNDAKEEWDQLYTQRSISTSYLVYTTVCVSHSGEDLAVYGYGTVQLFHPLKNVLRANVFIYILSLVVYLAVIAVITFSIYRIYRNKVEYEKNSRRLTRGVARDLEAPLATTKAYLDNWDCMSDDERSKYGKLICDEVDSMANLVTSYLEMQKILSGEVKVSPEEIDIIALIKSAYNRVKIVFDDRAKTSSAKSPCEVVMPDDSEHLIKADLKLMNTALRNYLTNMLKSADKRAEVSIKLLGDKVRVSFISDGLKGKAESVGMGIEINENIMNLLGFKHGSDKNDKEIVFWFETKKV